MLGHSYMLHYMLGNSKPIRNGHIKGMTKSIKVVKTLKKLDEELAHYTLW
jgi:hypothetical protein